jgi:gamma-glutamylcyclotransferase (GGCT)/AIG2-like uncharacterized protein YtfP
MLTGLKKLIFGSALPSAEWFEEADREVDFTPDMWNMERRQFQLLFVYDEMMNGHRQHNLISEHSVGVATAFSQEKFILWRKNLGKESYPIPLTKRYTSVPPARIKGELYAVSSPQYKELDKYKVNGVHFIRVRMNVDIPYRQLVKTRQDQGTVLLEEKIQTIRAWMYVGVPSFWDDMIDSGYLFSPVRSYTPNREWLGNYYYFSCKEYDAG